MGLALPSADPASADLAAILSVAAARATVTKGAMLLAVFPPGWHSLLLAAVMIEPFSSLFLANESASSTRERAMGV